MAPNPPTPVLLFGFSNDSNRPLEMLKTESAYVWQMLKELDKRGRVKVIREESLTNEELLDYLLDFQEAIVAIHFAGHGGGQALYTEGGATAPQGLKKVLEQLPNLKLVVLNACDTAEQAHLLLEAGIPMVIATTLPVEDEKAARFTKFFYGRLAGQASAREAFETAIGAVSSKKEWGLEAFADAPGRIVTYTRGVQLELDDDVPPPWRLFIREGEEAKLRSWRLARPVEDRGPLGIVQNLAVASDVLEGQAVYFREQPDATQEKIKTYFTRIIEQLDKKIMLIEKEKAQELSQEVIRGEAAADVFKGIMEHTHDEILHSILSSAEEQLRRIIGAKAQFLENLKHSGATEADKDDLIELLGFAKVRFEALRDML